MECLANPLFCRLGVEIVCLISHIFEAVFVFNCYACLIALALHHTRPVTGPGSLVLGWCCDLVLAFDVRSRRKLAQIQSRTSFQK